MSKTRAAIARGLWQWRMMRAERLVARAAELYLKCDEPGLALDACQLVRVSALRKEP